jgi:CPA2 family monovalent cation:H+ antiporter-2
MSTFTIAKESNLAGQTLRDIRIRELLGVNIAFIKRGEIMIQTNKTERLFPGDEICVIGSDDKLKNLLFLTKHEIEIPKKVNNEVILKQIELQRKLYWLKY